MEDGTNAAGRSAPASARILLVTSRKGGTGKSLCAAALAAALARTGERVLLADLDFFCHSADLLLGCENDVLFDISDLAAGRAAAEKCVLPVPDCAGLFFLPAPVLDGDAIASDALTDALFTAAAQAEASYIVADTHSDGDPLTAKLIPLAEAVISVTTPDAASLRGSELLSVALDAAGAKKVLLLVNRFDADAALAGCCPGPRGIVARTNTGLCGVIPESGRLRASACGLLTAPGGPPGTDGAFDRTAVRLKGGEVPLLSAMPEKKRRKLLAL